MHDTGKGRKARVRHAQHALWMNGRMDAVCIVSRTVRAAGSAPVVLGRVSPTWYFLDTRMGLQLKRWAMDGRGGEFA